MIYMPWSLEPVTMLYGKPYVAKGTTQMQLRWGQESIRGGGRERFDFGRRDGNVMPIAEIGVMRSMAMEWWELPGTGRSKEQLSLEHPEGTKPASTLILAL